MYLATFSEQALASSLLVKNTFLCIEATFQSRSPVRISTGHFRGFLLSYSDDERRGPSHKSAVPVRSHTNIVNKQTKMISFSEITHIYPYRLCVQSA